MSDLFLAGSEATRVRFSFEVFPARSHSAALALGHAVQHLAQAGPDFISVTYGASGSNREASLDLLKYLRSNTEVLPLAHITTIGQSEDDLRAEIHGMIDAGIHDFLALRGDERPDEDGEHSPSMSSVDLVRFIARMRAERPAFTSVGRTAVAAYPNGHPLSRSREADIDWLIQKQDAGASMAITQLFFVADEYLSFVSDARNRGLTIPVIPGLMPVSSSAQLKKVAELAGRPAPTDLEKALCAAGGFAPELGVQHTLQLARELLDGDAPSLHLYTFNRHEQVLSVLQELSLISNGHVN